MIIAIVIIVAILVLVFLSKIGRDGYYKKQNDWLIAEFSRCNVIVFGKKGTGKDVLFAHVIALRNEKHYSNIVYNDNTELVDMKEIAIGENSFIDLVENTIKRVAPRFEQGKDIYISDSGVVLPGHEDRTLDKRYPSMPLLYALSRHLYRNNIHINTQALTRPWKKLREQADSYIRVLENTITKKHIYLKVISYDNYNSAEKGLLPNSDKQFISTHGAIKYRRFKVQIKKLEYDSHYFATKFLEEIKDTNPIIEGIKDV